MKHIRITALLLGLGIAAASLAPTLLHAEEPTTKPTKAAKPKGRLVQPWSKLTGITDKQHEEIVALHAKAVAEIKAIEAKEHADITALLTDAQKAELEALDKATKAEQKQRMLENKEKDKDEPKDPMVP